MRYFSVVHIAPPDKVREDELRRITSFQIIFNAFHTIYRFGDTFTRSLCAWESTVPES